MTAPVRIQIRRTAGWRMPPNTSVVSRATIWGNPWAVGLEQSTFWWPLGERAGWRATMLMSADKITAEEAVAQYRDWLERNHLRVDLMPKDVTPHGYGQVRRDLAARRATILDRLPALRGRDLACWCAIGASCHGDVLLELAARES